MLCTYYINSYFELTDNDGQNFLAGIVHSKCYLHEMAAQEEDIKCKRILLTAREKQGIVNYCFERGESTPLI
jgi:hypothetical protein